MTLRQKLETSIKTLKAEVSHMADTALANLNEALVAFKTRDHELARMVIAKDDEVDALEEVIAKRALAIILKEQPVATDLRLVTGILKLITDLERIGDHAADIAEMTLHLPHTKTTRVLPLTTNMAKVVQTMLLDSIQALVTVDTDLAQAVIIRDQKVNDGFQSLISKMTNELKHDKIEAK